MFKKSIDKQLENKQKIIDRLINENKELRKQIEELEPEYVRGKVELTEKTYQEYLKLIDELNDLKSEYIEITQQAKIERDTMIKELKSLYKFD